MNHCKFFIIFFLIVFNVLSLSATDNNDGETKKSKVNVKQYHFAEELIELPIKPFVRGEIAESDLMSTSPHMLKIYENAVSAENRENFFLNANQIIKAWREVIKITDKNPFLQIANDRLAEWKTCIELFNRHQESLDKIKMIVGSSLLSDEQKINIVLLHLNEFGLSFGTKEIFDLYLIKKTPILKNPAFYAKVKEIKQKRCEHNLGKECYDWGKNFETEESEKFTLFKKSCELKYKPGCDEANKIIIAQETQKAKIKAAQEAEKAKLAAEEKRKADEFARRTFNFAEEVLDVIKPFTLGDIKEQEILSADPRALKLLEKIVSKEKQPDNIKKPGAMIVAWEEFTKIDTKNPFLPIATQRLQEWKNCLEKLDKYEKKSAEMKKVEADNSFPIIYRTAFAVNFLNEFGVSFGTIELLKAILYNNEISENEAIKNKVKDIRRQRCDLNSAIDCHHYALKNAETTEEKTTYLKKACKLGIQNACKY